MTKRKFTALLTGIIMAAAVLSGCASSEENNSQIQQTAATETEAPTEVPTEPPTEPPTEAPTEPPTEEYQVIQESEVFPDDPLFYMAESNSAGGLQFLWAHKYMGTKEVKYYTLYIKLYNAVGDEVEDEIKGNSQIKLKMIGPINPGEYLLATSSRDPLLYCSLCDKITIEKIELEYMDGTKDMIEYYYWEATQQYGIDMNDIVYYAGTNYPDLIEQVQNMN